MKCSKCRFDPWVGKVLWRRKWQPTQVFLPGKSHGKSIGSQKCWTQLIDSMSTFGIVRSMSLDEYIMRHIHHCIPYSIFTVLKIFVFCLFISLHPCISCNHYDTLFFTDFQSLVTVHNKKNVLLFEKSSQTSLFKK